MEYKNDFCRNCFEQRSSQIGPCLFCGYDPTPDDGRYPLALQPGCILAGRYILGRVLGQGGFGITYLAEDEKAKKSGAADARVAIKEFFPENLANRQSGMSGVTAFSGEKEEDFRFGREKFLEEAKTLAKFSALPNVVKVYSYFEENGTAYFAMEYVEGTDLKRYIQERGGKLSWEEAQRILLPVMDALSAVHAEGMIHRDVKPDNIFITTEGQIKLLDFGSARYSLGDRSHSLDVILTAGYAPKEQYTRRGRQGPYTDVYSVAACFYAALTGCVPPESVERMEEDDLVPPSARGVKLPSKAEDAILRGLEVRASDRWQTMEEFKQALGIDEGKEPAPAEAEQMFAEEKVETTLTKETEASGKTFAGPKTEEEDSPTTQDEAQKAANTMQAEGASADRASMTYSPAGASPKPKKSPVWKKAVAAAAIVAGLALAGGLLLSEDTEMLPVAGSASLEAGDSASTINRGMDLPEEETGASSKVEAEAEEAAGSAGDDGSSSTAAGSSSDPSSSSSQAGAAAGPAPQSGTKQYEDGTWYEGTLVNDVPNGEGTLYYANGNIAYTGGWKNGKKDGRGTQYYENGNIKYVGDWTNDRLNGQGTYYWENGQWYEGAWADGQRTGHGIHHWANGDWDECSYVDDKRYGQGTRYYANGNVRYTGEWANNEFNGQGTYYWENGSWYEGNWTDGNMNGQGTMHYADGSGKTGTWEDGKFIG